LSFLKRFWQLLEMVSASTYREGREGGRKGGREERVR
jgi:hypothetical protein